MIKGSSGQPEVLVDVISKSYDLDLVAWLKEINALKSIQKVVLTRLNPERMDSLKKVLKALDGAAELLVSKAASQLLKDRSGKTNKIKKSFVLKFPRLSPKCIYSSPKHYNKHPLPFLLSLCRV